VQRAFIAANEAQLKAKD